MKKRWYRSYFYCESNPFILLFSEVCKDEILRYKSDEVLHLIQKYLFFSPEEKRDLYFTSFGFVCLLTCTSNLKT